MMKKILNRYIFFESSNNKTVFFQLIKHRLVFSSFFRNIPCTGLEKGSIQLSSTSVN